jgi:hypothetical protein
VSLPVEPHVHLARRLALHRGEVAGRDLNPIGGEHALRLKECNVSSGRVAPLTAPMMMATSKRRLILMPLPETALGSPVDRALHLHNSTRDVAFALLPRRNASAATEGEALSPPRPGLR